MKMTTDNSSSRFNFRNENYTGYNGASLTFHSVPGHCWLSNRKDISLSLSLSLSLSVYQVNLG